MTSFDVALDTARVELQELAEDDGASFTYLRSQSVKIAALAYQIGFYGVVLIVPLSQQRFEFGRGHDQAQSGFVFEAVGADGESIVDLAAWTIEAPHRPLSMFGRIGLLNAWEAFGSATYFCGGALAMRQSPLAWLQAGCSGSAIVDRQRAARQLLDIPGPLAAEDVKQARDLVKLAQSVFDASRVLVPKTAKAA